MMEPAAAFSSNNPFRTRSPFAEDDNTGFFTPPQPIPSRTASAQEDARPFSFFQNDEAAVSSTHSLPEQTAFST